MSGALKASALTLFFLLELGTYATAIWWSVTVPSGVPLRIVSAVVTFGVLVLAWSRFGAPTASHHLTGGARAVLLAVWFGSAVAGLLWMGRPWLAGGFAVLAVLASVYDLTA